MTAMRGAREKSSERSSSPDAQRASQQPEEAVPLQSWRELQQTIGNRAVLRLLGAGALQTKLKLSQSSDVAEQEADRIAARIAGGTSGLMVQRKSAQLSGSGVMVQRAAAAGGEATAAASPGAQAEASPAPARAAPSLIVEDDAKEMAPGQMRKSDFLSQLRSAVCSAADDALSGTMWSAMGCPYIERWLDHYSKQPSSYVERALRKYAPETASARSAAEYIPIVTQRVRRGIAEWTSTGEVADLPEEFAAGGMPGATVGGLVSGALSGIGSAVSGAVGAIGGALSSVGSMLFKGREEGAREVEDPVAIQAQLGAGQSLDGHVKGRMEDAFGMSFSGVRVHADAKAQKLSADLNARAFTVGSDIAFAAGEYQPDSLIGDALIAHELAHVAQQSGGSSPAPLGKGGTEYNSLEEDADVSAVGAMMSTLIGTKGLITDIGRQAMPRVRSGLRLQRCSSKPGQENTKRWEEIKKVLETIPTGKEALKVIQENSVSVRFQKDNTVFDVESNTILINSATDIVQAAIDVAHEAHHARTKAAGTKPDVKKLGRDEYIKRMIEEEAEGTVRSIEAKMELEGTAVDVSKASFPLEAEYRAAHKAAVDAAKAKDPKLSEADAQKIGREAGLKRVIKGFKDGDVRTDNTKETYTKYYGDDWDKFH